MKFNSMKITGLALLSALSLSACKPDVEEELPIVTALVSGAVQSAGSGNCAISLNLTGMYSGQVLNIAVLGAADSITSISGQFLAQYNRVNSGAQVTAATLITAPYNLKFDAFFTINSDWTEAVRANYLNTVATAADTNGFTAVNAGLTTTAFAGLKGLRGTSILACGRIPRSSCSVAALTTASRAADTTAQAAIVNLILSTAEARKSPAIVSAVKSTGFSGLPTTTVLTLFDGTFAPTSGGSTSSFSGNNILATNAYPKFGTLVTLGFGNLMPVSEGTRTYALDATTFTQGSNLAVTPVASCESLGLSGIGITQTAGLSTSLPLTPQKEIAYAFSNSGSAAALYSTAVGSSGILDAVNFNKALRSRFAVPLVLNQGKLDDISTASGNGGATATLTTCIYGQTAAIRTTAATTLASSLPGLTECPAAASSAAAKFGDPGNQTLASFPNN